MKTAPHPFPLVGACFVAAFLIAGAHAFPRTAAASVFDIAYPIAELGGCTSQSECKAYCDMPENELPCLKWAQDNGFTPKREQQREENSGASEEQLRLDEEAFSNAPGGCKSPRECDAYCRVEEHLDECMDYSVKYGYMTAEEAAKIREQARKGGPGGCKSESQCDNYCRAPEHARECMSFVVEEGKITQEEADFMVEQMTKPGGPGGKPSGKGPAEPKIKEEKVQSVLQEKPGPGGCKSMQECAAYCQGGEHMEECISFAQENGIMEKEDAEKAKKLMTIGGPGGCKGPEECDAFCSKKENGKTCFEFSRTNGLLSEEEAVMMEKQMQIVQKLERQAGPGGCKSQEECGAYCSDQTHIEECINFAGKQSGGLSGDRVRQMMGQTQEAKDKVQQMEEFRRPKEEMEGRYEGPMIPPENMPYRPEGEGQQGHYPPQGGESRSYGPPPGFDPSMRPPEGFKPDMMPPPEGFGPGMPPPSDGAQPQLVPMAPASTPAPTPEPPPAPISMRSLRMLGAVLAPILDFFSFGTLSD